MRGNSPVLTSMLISVYDAHNKKNNNDKRVIGIEQLNLSAVLKMITDSVRVERIYSFNEYIQTAIVAS